MNKISAIIQARMGSTRLPGKVLREISGRPIIWHVINRLKSARTLQQIVLATTELKEDDAVAVVAQRSGATVFRGDENDVLDRYYQAARANGADPIVRVTADCPLIDPRIVDEVVNEFISSGADYVSIGEPGGAPTFPDGLDVEVFSFKALEKTWREAKKPSEREHVTPYIYQNPEPFRTHGYALGDPALGELRLTVDDERDLELVTKIYAELYKSGEVFHLEEILALLDKRPELLEINRGTIRNEGYLISLRKDP